MGPRSAVALTCLLLISSREAASQIGFADVSAAAGMNHSGQSFGAAWGDVNGDGWADLWVSNHSFPPALYQNQGNGSFIDVADSVWPGPVRDTHGAAWADFDRDGDQDLVEVVGGANANHLWVSEGGSFVDRAQELGVDLPGARSRTPLWFDWNRDGWLDLVTANASHTFRTRLLTNTGAGFVDETGSHGFLEPAANYAQLGDLTGDDALDLLLHTGIFPGLVYDSASLPTQFVNVRGNLDFPPPTFGTDTDSTSGDFNGDLLTDLFIAKAQGSREVVAVSDTEVRARLHANASENLFTFESAGEIQISLYPSFTTTPAQLIRIGASGISGTSYFFTLSPSDPEVQGFPSYTPGVDEGFFVGWDPLSGEWSLSFSTPSNRSLYLTINPDDPVANLTTIGFPPTPTPPSPHLHVRNATGFEEGPAFAPDRCNSVVSGDFDNDMDLDVYLACTGLVVNHPNILLENTGGGVLVPVSAAGGAEGSTEGRADSVVTADYDQDGFLDLFVTNGDGPDPFNNGPDQLFRNLGNQNHWIEIDLIGDSSNREGIGARVLVSAGGVVQVREQNGGIHRSSQNHQRLHIGLGPHTQADLIEVEWPSGIEQHLENVPADQILTLSEPVPIPAARFIGIVAAAASILVVAARTVARNDRYSSKT